MRQAGIWTEEGRALERLKVSARFIHNVTKDWWQSKGLEISWFKMKFQCIIYYYMYYVVIRIHVPNTFFRKKKNSFVLQCYCQAMKKVPALDKVCHQPWAALCVMRLPQVSLYSSTSHTATLTPTACTPPGSCCVNMDRNISFFSD